MKRATPKQLYEAQKYVRNQIKSIPKKNKEKFSVDLLKLIAIAHEDDYENFHFE